MMRASIRKRLNQALAGNFITEPVYAVYDWFVINRDIDWRSMFDLGLGQINHASLLDIEHPHLKIEETYGKAGDYHRRDVKWITDIGELNECYLDDWRKDHLIKTSDDYRIMKRALEDVRFVPSDKYFDESEEMLGDSGITVGQFGQMRELGYNRTPFQVIQIDFCGLEQFSIDIALEKPELMELLEMMNEQMLDLFGMITKSRAVHVKLWENLCIESFGPDLFRKHHVPMYARILDILEGTGKRLQVHFDGKLQIIADDITGLLIDGIDSLTPVPEGDMSIKAARKRLA